MSFQLGFITSDYNQGKSILIKDASTDWADVPGGIVSVTFAFTSLYSNVVLVPSTIDVTILVGTSPFEEGFQYEVTSVDLGFDAEDTIPDGIYDIVMTISDPGGTVSGDNNTYESDEVVYYNAQFVRDNFIASKASYLDSVYNKDMDYANWLDFLITSIEANANNGNSSAIYYIFDIFNRLSA